MADHMDIHGILTDICNDASEQALEALYVEYYSKLKVFIECYLASNSCVDEVISNTFMAIWQNRAKLLDVRNFDAYIFTIAKQQAISSFRAEARNSRRRVDVNLPDSPFDFSVGSRNPESDLISEEFYSKLDRALNELPPKCKMVFQMVKMDKLRYKDVADILGLSVKTVENHMALAVKKLRKAFNED